ncbi:MAG TPA: HEPN domain-containing protein [Dehalococcoidia bacterium]|nr:HEPN domain-containing protein [Dehalococcoidia bacterium]
MAAEEARAALARRLLLAAREDLALGHRALQQPPLPNGAVFHAQQAAEKALKAFLAWNDLPPKPTHDLTELLTICTPVRPDFVQLEDSALMLTPYAIAGRYPDVSGGLAASVEQAEDALREAEGVVNFAVERLPNEAQP